MLVLLDTLRIVIQALVPMLSMGALYAWYFWAATSRLATLQVSPPPPAAAAPRSSRHPEPLAQWTRTACAVIDDHGIWLDESPSRAAQMLHAWNVSDVTTWREALLHLLEDTSHGLGAWDAVRAIRVLMAGARLGWCKEVFAWAATRVIAGELARRYVSFTDVATDYVVDRRRWARLPLDGSADDVCTQQCAARIGWLRFDGVAFTAFFDAPAHPKLRDIDALRTALGAWIAKPSAVPPALPALARCAFCRDVFRGRPRVCPSCGAPTADAARTKEHRRLRA